MTLFTSVGVTCINTDALERLARAESTSARAVCVALAPERAPATRRAVASIDPLPDYRVLTLGQLEVRAGQTSDPIRALLRTIIAEAKALGIGSIVFPTSARPGYGDGDVITVPAFVKEAHSASPLTAPPASAERGLDADTLLRSVGEATAWMRPHLDGIEIAAAKAARALQVGPLASAIEGEDPRHEALRAFLNGIAIVLAIRTRKRVGGGDTLQEPVLALAVHQLLIERFGCPKTDAESSTRMFEVARRSMLGRMVNPRSPAHSAYFRALERLIPAKQRDGRESGEIQPFGFNSLT